MTASTIMILSGGTGGHVYPALAVARALRAADVAVVWMGTGAGIEARLVPDAGIPLHTIHARGVRGKDALTRLMAPLVLTYAVLQALIVLWRVRPQAVLGMGGYVAVPGGIAAWLLRRPLVIHEQNAVAGLANRGLARLATAVLEAFPGSFAGPIQAEHTGNPLRPEITAIPPPSTRLMQRTGAPRLLILGGSLGARPLNRVVPPALRLLPAQARPEIWHQAGAAHYEEVPLAYRQAGVTARVQAFIDDIAAAYAWADLVLCRAGAMTVAELAAVGVAAILVPYPHAVDDHQTRNARHLESAGAAYVIPQHALTPERLAGLLGGLLTDPARRLAMAEAARRCARPDATARVAACCLALAK